MDSPRPSDLRSKFCLLVHSHAAKSIIAPQTLPPSVRTGKAPQREVAMCLRPCTLVQGTDTQVLWVQDVTLPVESLRSPLREALELALLDCGDTL